LKAVNKLPGISKAEIDEDAILLRAYGKGTDVLIDRESTYNIRTQVTHRDLIPAQRRLDHTVFWPATASPPLYTLGLRTVFFTSTLQALCAHLPTCVDQRFGEE
jgi:hypothetical protein